MNLIAAADANWGIGIKNKLLVNIPADMRRFQELTMGKVLLVGRRTLEGFPGKRPLPGRRHIVLSRSREFVQEGVTAVRSVEEALLQAAAYPSKDVFVAGGEQIYRQLLPYCDTAYITRIHYTYEADAFFPRLGRENGWELLEQSGEQTCYDLVYHFCVYKKAGS